MKKTLTDLYSDYSNKYDGKPKHLFSRFVIILSKYNYHRIHIRPKIEWWSNVNFK